MPINQNITLKKLVSAFALSAMALAGLFVSCAQIEENNAGKTAYLDFSAISVDYTVENLTPTKASVPDSDLPEAGDFTIRISGQGGEPIVYEPGTLPSEVVLAPGEYTVEAVYGENTFGEPYFYKSVQVSLLPEDKKTVPLTDITLENAMLAVTLPDDFGTHLTVSSIVVSDSKGGSMNIETGRYVYVPSGSEVYVTFNGTNSACQNKSIKVTLGTLKPQCAYNIVCNLDLPTLSFADQRDGAWAGRLYLTSLATSDKTMDMSAVKYMLSSDGGASWAETVPEQKDGYWLISGLDKNKTYSIKAVLGELVSNSWTFEPSESSSLALSLAHTKDSSGNLDGTKATVSGDVPYPSRLAGLISSKGSYGAELTDAGGNVVRTLSAKAGEMAVANNWPYLPQGTYTLKSYYQIGEDKVYSSDVVSATAEKPSVTLDVSAYTSYDWYSQNNIETANKLENRLKVMSRKVTLSISNEILRNDKYSSLLTLSSVTYPNETLSSFSISSTSSNTITYDDVTYTDTQLGKYTFAASVTFDGAICSDSHDCWITGLPYSVDFGNSREWYGWTSNSASWSFTSAVYKLKFNSGFIVSPKFEVPTSGINVNVPAKVQYYYWNSTISKRTATFSLGATGSTSTKATIYDTADVKSDVYTTNRSNDVSFQTTMTESLPYISISSNQNDTFIYSLVINYGNAM